ncbi:MULTISPECIES: alpha/beta hydrolase [Brenneria]|uniref:Alpha/beta fold hydrolase n=1 Tax=Brenneria nigrifluens DSM 30175 = ATCC 13028 TaxID=1121120 RepID=A0A2U1UPT9_9GAMM|nr:MULTISPECIES: alpha/beta hydrolase [Brenneria]EHD21419.1 alpha/beta hydrolase fold protein [Brenneria sp. EniD312]PWC23634.1 alpha/beta hydrolase [Brenneria nigrifluens] [Brenneria nigrifluens DSM 30175 = ATCC 13028]QCR04544.1 alpha/beta fold hydrolase [Brenneria nigrifluens DSM 30175 = ATCC 13028]
MKRVLTTACISLFLSFPVTAETVRHDFTITTEDGIRIFVRELRDTDATADRGPMLMVNGGRSGVLASWDVDAPGTSAAQEIAKAGHQVYLMDVRGFGRSEFPPEMHDTSEARNGPVAVRSNEAVRDIAAVVTEIRRRHPGDKRLTAIGWATGSQWLGHYASLYPERLSHLVYYNAAYGGPAGRWQLQQEFGDPQQPTELNRSRHGAYRFATVDNLVGRWRDEGIDAAFLARYVQLSMEGDVTANTREPPSFRFPSGPTADTLKLVNGRQIFDASFIRSHVLILRSEREFWSRPTDVTTLRSHLTNAASVEVVQIAGASHYVHLQPTADRQKFLNAILAFTAPLAKGAHP